MSNVRNISYVAHLPDLITWEDYETCETRRLVRIRIETTAEGLVIIADSPIPHAIESLLAELDPRRIEMMLCG